MKLETQGAVITIPGRPRIVRIASNYRRRYAFWLIFCLFWAAVITILIRRHS